MLVINEMLSLNDESHVLTDFLCADILTDSTNLKVIIYLHQI